MNLIKKSLLFTILNVSTIFSHGLGFHIDQDCLVLVGVPISKTVEGSFGIFEIYGYSNRDTPINIYFACGRTFYDSYISPSGIEVRSSVGRYMSFRLITTIDDPHIFIFDMWTKLRYTFSNNTLMVSSLTANKTWIRDLHIICDPVNKVHLFRGYFMRSSCESGNPIWKVQGSKQIQIPLKNMESLELSSNQTFKPTLSVEGKRITLQKFEQGKYMFQIHVLEGENGFVLRLEDHIHQFTMIEELHDLPTTLTIQGGTNDLFWVTQILRQSVNKYQDNKETDIQATENENETTQNKDFMIHNQTTENENETTQNKDFMIHNQATENENETTQNKDFMIHNQTTENENETTQNKDSMTQNGCPATCCKMDIFLLGMINVMVYVSLLLALAIIPLIYFTTQTKQEITKEAQPVQEEEHDYDVIAEL